MMPAQFQVDVFDELSLLLGAVEPLVLSGVMRELEGLSREKGRDGVAARCALALAEKCSVIDCSDLKSMSVDAQMIEYAARNHCTVLTNDRYIRDALFARGVCVVSMRKQKKLEIMRR